MSIILSQILIFKNTLNECSFQKLVLHKALFSRDNFSLVIHCFTDHSYNMAADFNFGLGGFFFLFVLFSCFVEDFQLHQWLLCCCILNVLLMKGTASFSVAIKWHHSKGQHYGCDLLLCGFAVVGLLWVSWLVCFYKTHLEPHSTYKWWI